MAILAIDNVALGGKIVRVSVRIQDGSTEFDKVFHVDVPSLPEARSIDFVVERSLRRLLLQLESACAIIQENLPTT